MTVANPAKTTDARGAADDERKNVMAEMGRKGANKRWAKKKEEQGQPPQLEAKLADDTAVPA